MPTRAFTKAELEESMVLLQVAKAIEASADGDSEDDDEDVAQLLVLAACEPAMRRVRQEIGVEERLSIDRLRREAAAAGIFGDDMNASVMYHWFGFRLSELPVVVQALQPPAGIRTRGSVAEICLLS
ncbi:hypothetical protein AB1Y20_020119 [Prymnesium parvum]|uniref:RNA helicase n=1 Tax=Prymnesium parvum TaxID=97485 RepID=A0AB34JSP7_PRYPA